MSQLRAHAMNDVSNANQSCNGIEIIKTIQSSQPSDLLMKYRVYSLSHTKIVQITMQKIEIARNTPWIPEGLSRFGIAP